MTGAVWSDVSEQQRLSYSPCRTQPRAVQMLQLLGVSKKNFIITVFYILLRATINCFVLTCSDCCWASPHHNVLFKRTQRGE